MTTLIPKFDLKNGEATPTGAVNRSIYEKLSEQISVKDFGATGDGTTNDTTAIQNALNYVKTTYQTLYFPAGTYLVTALNCSASNATGFNKSLTIKGDGSNSTFINIVPNTNNVANTIGIDLSGAANVIMHDLSITGGSSATNCPNVTMLLSKTYSSGIIFSGNMEFQNVIISAYGSYGVFNLGVEQTTWLDSGIVGLVSQCANPLYISKVNTPAITSPNTTLNSPADSMTVFSFSGSKSYVYSTGVRSVFFDVGTSQISTVSFEDTYFPAYGSGATIFSDNGTSGTGVITGISLRNIRLEMNYSGATGSTCNQQAALFSADCSNWDVVSLWSSANMLAGTIQWQFTNCVASRFNIGGNISGSFSSPIFKATGSGAGCNIQINAPVSNVSITSGNYYAIGSDNAELVNGTTDGNLNNILLIKSGGSSSSLSSGGIKRQTTASVANSATTIFGSASSAMSFGELITVTGVGAGRIFADLLMCSYYTVTVISSNTQSGSPATRTYSISSGKLQLTMGDTQAMAITVQSLVTGGYGA